MTRDGKRGWTLSVSESRPGRGIAANSLERFDRPLSCEYIESSKSREIERLCRPPVSLRVILFDFFKETFEFIVDSISPKEFSSIMPSDFILPFMESELGRPAPLLIEKLE